MRKAYLKNSSVFMLILSSFIMLYACTENASRLPDGDASDGDSVEDGDEIDTDGDAESGEKPYTVERQDLEANAEIEFVDEMPVKFSLKRGAITDEDDWDLTFDGWKILTNGGLSGNASGGGAAFRSTDYHTLSQEDLPPMIYLDTHGSIFDDWYDYKETILHSNKTVYLIRTEGKLFKLQILSYYGEVAGSPVAAMYSLQYAEIKENHNGETVTVTRMNGTAGGLEALGDAGYLSLTDGKLNEMTDAEASSSTEWHIRFKRFDINLNGGLSGQGNIAGYVLSTKDFKSVRHSDMPNTENFEADRLKPVVDRWVQLDENGHVVFADYVYAILAADGKSWFKFYPLTITNPDENGYSQLEFRFDPLP